MTGPKLLEKWRSERELTQKDAAALFKMSQSALCDYEKGKKVPRVDTAVRMDRVSEGFIPVESWVSEAS